MRVAHSGQYLALLEPGVNSAPHTAHFLSLIHIYTHHPAVGFHIRGMVKQVEGAGAVELKGGCHTPGLGLRLFQELLVQVLQKRGFSRIKPKGCLLYTSLAELPLLFEKLKDGGALGQSVPKSDDEEKEEN